MVLKKKDPVDLLRESTTEYKSFVGTLKRSFGNLRKLTSSSDSYEKLGTSKSASKSTTNSTTATSSSRKAKKMSISDAKDISSDVVDTPIFSDFSDVDQSETVVGSSMIDPSDILDVIGQRQDLEHQMRKLSEFDAVLIAKLHNLKQLERKWSNLHNRLVEIDATLPELEFRINIDTHEVERLKTQKTFYKNAVERKIRSRKVGRRKTNSTNKTHAVKHD